MKKNGFLLLFLMIIFSVSAQMIIPQGSTWKYLDDGSNQGTAWRAPSFDDSAWASGNAQLGYGDGDEATVISYGPSANNKYICYYFRKTFTVADPNANTGLKLSLLRDDGAVVYINGTEVVRSNMPSGVITYLTHASSTVAGSAEDEFNEFSISSSVLNQGDNVIAVEVHQRSGTSSDVSFDMKLEFAGMDYYKKLPYVIYPGQNDRMMILWQLNTTETCTLKYGTDTNYTGGTITSTEFNIYHQHKVLLTGLEPDQKYYYQVSVNNAAIEEGSFNTAPPIDETSVTFFAYGDTRTYINKHNQVADRIMQDIEQHNLKQTFVINSGDLVSNGDSESSWQSEFFNPQYTHITDMLANLPYVTALGNHEGQGLLFEKYFPYPIFQNDRYYYSFNYGPVHVTVIDSETSFSPGSTQYNWLVNDLSLTNKPWKIAVFHRPGWSAGGGHSNSSAVQTYLQPLFEEYGVSFVINGHNHYYSRATVNGVQHITTGGGGAPLYYPESNYPYIVKVSRSYHYCKIEINDNILHFSAIKSNGSVIEEFDTEITPSAISKANTSMIDMHPNPANSFVVVEGEGIRQIEIMDLRGMIIRRIPVSGESSVNVDMSDLEKGIYLISVKTEVETVVKKIFVE